MNGPSLARAALLALAIAAAPPQEQRPAFRSGIDLVHVAVSVTDRKGNPATELTEQDFEVYEDGKRQQIRYFLSGGSRRTDEAAPAPELHLGTLLDMSGSMENDIALVRSAAIKFLNTLTDADDITLVDFDTEVRIARYHPSNFPRLVERIRRLKPDGYTALYDAIGVFLDNAFSDQGRKILVVYTDGADNQSSITLADLRQLLRASDVTVYTIGFLEHLSTAARVSLQVNLREIAEITGGQFFAPLSIKDLSASYEKVRREIDAQYELGYLSTNERTDGAWRKVQIKLVGPGRKGLALRARQGYFAPYRDKGRGRGPAAQGTAGGPSR